MKNLIIFSTLLQFLANTHVIDAQCTTTLNCLHSGQFNTATCRCDCFPNYSGTYCETVNCVTADPAACISFSTGQCSSTSIKDYCPRLCNARGCTCSNGIDQCLNGGTFNSNTCTCSCPTGFTGSVCQTISSCTTLTCQNSGVFNTVSCKCDCFANYQGNSCETLDCAVADSVSCISFSQSSCPIPVVQHYCPNKCGRCLSTSTATTTTTTTTTPTTVTTTTTTTTTTTPTTVTTTLPTTTTTTTPTTTATTLPTTVTTTTTTLPTTTTTTLPTTTTTTASTSTTTASTSTTTCATLTCAYGLIMDAASCTCICRTGFSGTLCDSYNCATPAEPSLVGFCAFVTCSDDAKLLCPNKCICGQ